MQWGTLNKIEKNFAGLESLSNSSSAEGGSDVETVSEMKVRAFEVLSRRNLTTSSDFENEVRALTPDTYIVKALTYEEKNRLSSLFSGNVVICVGDENGKEISGSNLEFLIDSMKPRVTLGTNISFLPPDVIPVHLTIEVYYDPGTVTTSTEFLANQIFEILQSYFSPVTLGLGQNLNYQDVAKSIYQLDFVKSINNFSAKLMIKEPGNVEGYCAGFSGEEDEVNQKCLYNYFAVVDQNSQTQASYSPISTYKLYKAEIGLTSINDYSALTFTYDNLYTP